MNRAERRKINRQVSKKLTEEQFAEFKSEANKIYVNQELDKMSQKLICDVVEILPEVLRNNRVSEERTSKILTDFSIAYREKYREIFKGEN